MGDVADKLVAIGFSLLILWQSWVVRRAVGTWLFPSCIFGLFWFAYTFIPLILVPSAPIEPLAIAYILICSVFFSASACFFDWRPAFSRKRIIGRFHVGSYSSGFLRFSFWMLTALCIVFLFVNSLIQGFSISDIAFNFFESAARYTEMRYGDELISNIYSQLSIVFAYVAVVLGGFIFASSFKRRERFWVALWSLLPSVLVMLTQSAKGQFLLAVVMFYAATLLCKLDRGDTSLFPQRTIRSGIVWAAISFPIITVSFMVRGLYAVDDTGFVVDRLIYYFASYTSGHLYAFADWFSHTIGGASKLQYADEPGSYGFYTFMALFRLGGVDRYVPQGIFDDYFSYSELLTTNIFTMYRGLILDFGLIGSMVYMLISGVILHLAYYCLLVSHRPSVSAATFIYMMGYFYTSFIISILIWNSIYVSFVMLAGILWLNHLINSRRTDISFSSRECSTRP